MKLLLILVLFFYVNPVQGQIEGEVYTTIFRNHLESILESDANFNDNRSTIYILNNENVKNIPKKMSINEKEIDIIIVTRKKIKRKKIKRVAVFNSIDFENQFFYIDIVDFLVGKKSTYKKLDLINVGGTRCRFIYNCKDSEYKLECEYSSH